jgi:AraC-like DNA-binding protein
MNITELLWVDLRRRPDMESMFESICVDEAATRIVGRAGLCAAIADAAPRKLCFEFDEPEVSGLQALQGILHRFPSLPLLVLTEYHSERLAVWAFRSGARDFLVKPVSPTELSESLRTLSAVLGDAQARPGRALPIPLEDCFCARAISRNRTDTAATYVASHLQGKILEGTLAGLCHMSASQFSRVFKLEHKVTLREFILRARVERAREILRHADTSVSKVAYAVGFNDLSHFARVFRRFVGVAPTRYVRSLGQG